MNAERLLEVYEQISEAPDAIARLRRFVLDLAVRGKLVEQDASDGSASHLPEKIEKRKAAILKETSMRKPRKVADMNPAEIWADLPANWAWTQISNLGFISPRNVADDDAEASFVPMPMIFAEYGIANDHEARLWGEIKKGYTHFADGDVGLAKITPCFENGKSTVFRNLTGGFGSGTTELHVLRPVLVDPDYVVLFLKSPQFIETGIPKMTGTAGQKRVSSEYFTSSPFPLPPLAEQHRIVAKVDELMALCDRLEEARKTREETRDKLTAASLARLTAADTTPEDFPAHANFAIEALPALTTRADQIKTLRQTILNLAVRGKLVEQDPGDEPAFDALNALRSEKQRLAESGRLRSIRFDESKIIESDCPAGWIWVAPEQLSAPEPTALTIGPFGSNLTKSDYREAGVPLTFVADVTSDFSIPTTKFITEKKAQELRGHRVSAGDLVITKMGDPPGTPAIYPADRADGIITADCIKWTLAPQLVDAHFAKLAVRSDIVRLQVIDITKGGAHQKVSLKRFRGISFPLPPLTEQHRIVARVKELMSLCDRLEAALTSTDTTRTRLLEALLHEALEPAADVLEAAE